MRQPKPYEAGDLARVIQALDHLCKARDLLKLSANPHTLKRVRLAISSCRGAVRIQGYREIRAGTAMSEFFDEHRRITKGG